MVYFFIIIIFNNWTSFFVCSIMFLCMTVLAEETATREVWEETGVRAGNCVEDYVAYILLIPVIC